MAESDTSSEMSDGALHKLVTRLVEGQGALEDDTDEELDDEPDPNAQGGAMSEHMADTDSTGSVGDPRLLAAATGSPAWSPPTPTEISPQPSLQEASCSPRAEGVDEEALCLLASSDGSSASLDGAKNSSKVAPAAPSVNGEADAEAEADSCGYEGDVGESLRVKPPTRRPTNEVLVPYQGATAKDGGDEADDEGADKAAPKSRLPSQPATLEMSAKNALANFGHARSFCRMSETSGGSPWESLNETLREQGFQQIPLSRPGGALIVPDIATLADTLRDVVFQHGERGKIIQEMSLELSKNHHMAGHRDRLLNDSFRREKADMTRRSVKADARLASLEEEHKLLQERLAKETRRLKAENANLIAQLKQSEHRVKVKEASAQALATKLREEAEKERSRKHREREMLRNYQQKEVRRGGTNESRMTESILAHGKARESAESELCLLRAEVSRLVDDLREKENTILRHRLGPDWTPTVDDRAPSAPDDAKDMRDRLAEYERTVRVLRQREIKALEQRSRMEGEIEDLQKRLHETQEALANVELDLSSRPSLRAWRSSQRRIQDLETKLAQATSQAKEAMDVAELRRWVDTRELMRRDKDNHRLKLDRLDSLPGCVMKQVLQDSCRLLALQDVSLLGPSIAKLTKAVQMLPRLERFVNRLDVWQKLRGFEETLFRRVCVFVFRTSAEVLCLPDSESLSQVLSERRRTMEDVLPLLELWRARAEEPAHLKEFRRQVQETLRAREGQLQPSQELWARYGKSDKAIISTIQRLVELERRSMEEVQLNQQADRDLHEDAVSPVNRVVKHFQLLFGVKSISGCIAKLNEVYRYTSETQTFLRMAGDLLGMPDASPEAVMKRLEADLGSRPDVDPDGFLRVSHEADSWEAGE